ncbi:MAG TPA: hypothetical protein VKV25_08170, partial [Acidimicrobiales bacterium]|nr:hypothetical protein [Acidimicrobiales bacterium]
AAFGRLLDLAWRRASYSSITAAAHGDAVASEPEDPGVADEPPAPGPLPGAGPAGLAGRRDIRPEEEGPPLGPLASLPGGREVGTFVHGVLEGADFAAPDLDPELRRAARQVPAPPGLDPPAAAVSLADALRTPLGPLIPGLRLRDVRRADRLDELAFELPLAGGDRPTGAVGTADLAAVLARHLDPTGPLAEYADRLADPSLATELRGYLTGSLDLVFRHRRDGGEAWYVADYKTNWLGAPDRALTPWDYRPSALDAEMQRRHYPLQAVLYMVALHRYLRWRLLAYRAEDHLGGVLYLFLRGMSGPEVPHFDGHPAGVFSWAPPAALVTELSDLLDRGTPP